MLRSLSMYSARFKRAIAARFLDMALTFRAGSSMAFISLVHSVAYRTSREQYSPSNCSLGKTTSLSCHVLSLTSTPGGEAFSIPSHLARAVMWSVGGPSPVYSGMPVMLAGDARPRTMRANVLSKACLRNMGMALESTEMRYEYT